MKRREFLSGGVVAALATISLGSIDSVAATQVSSFPTTEKWEKYKAGVSAKQQFPSICVYCAGGCGVLVTTSGGELVEIEGDPYHPINRGALCSKAGAYLQLVKNERRLLYPMKRTNPSKGRDEDPGWVRITWDEAYALISEKVKEALSGYPYKNGTDYYYDGKLNPVAWLGSSYWTNEECYLGKKLISLLGSNNVEHQARKCHASTVVGLANTFGFGAMTNHIVDAKNSKVFLIMSNPAESHTMEFKWVTEAIEKNGAKVIVLDPRFSRTCAKADIYARYRSGAEAALFLGLIRYLIFEKPERIDWPLIENRTNAPYKWDNPALGPLPNWKDENSGSVFDKLKATVSKYVPEEVERIAGISKDKFLQIADVFTGTKPGNIYYSMGTTQHTNAVQTIRAHAILQLLLGNMGVPGGGVNALRGISNVQGSTDMNLLSHVIMGYRSPPTSILQIKRYQKWKNGGGPWTSGNDDTDTERRGGSRDVARTKYPWANIATAEAAGKAKEFREDDRFFPTWNALEYHWGIYVGTWPGVDPDNEPVVCDLPVFAGNPIVQLFRAIRDGKIKVLLCNGENPAVSVPNVNLVREALSKPGLFTVVNEIFETETAWYADVLLPGTTRIERSGSITNTGRWIQWAWKAVDPPGECKPELIYLTELYRKIREVLRGAGIKLPSEKFEEENFGVDVKKTIGTFAVQNNPEIAWPSRFVADPTGIPTPEDIYKEIGAKSITVGGVTVGHPHSAANVLYRNSWDPTAPEPFLPKRRDPNPVDAEDEKYGYYKNWAFSWMDNQRVLYNANESNPGVKTFFVWFVMNYDKWIGLDRAAIWSLPLYDPTKPATNPLSQGLPLHNEPLESPDADLSSEYPTMWDSRIPDVVTGTPADYPYVLTTFRLAEHMQAGAMTRNLPWLVECQPEPFVEMSRELGSELGVQTGDYVLVKTARNTTGIRVKALVNERMAPLGINGRVVHEVAMPWHWGFKGLSIGPSANEVTIDAVDVSANIPEYKVCLCKVEKAQ